jgi:hypothetical protein
MCHIFAASFNIVQVQLNVVYVLGLILKVIRYSIRYVSSIVSLLRYDIPYRIRPGIDYFADFCTDMGPYMSQNVCFIRMWTEIHKHMSNLMRSCMGSTSTVVYTGTVP